VVGVGNTGTLLVDDIVSLLERFGCAIPVYALALAYDSEVPLPPFLGLGTVEESRQWVDAEGAQVADYLWNPAEFKLFDIPELSLNSEKYEEIWQQLLLEVGAGAAYVAARDIVIQAAQSLNRQDWSGVLATSDNFVVYAVNIDLSDLSETLPACVDAGKLKTLREQNLLPAL